MNASETGKLLGVMALFDNRKVGEADIVAWLKAIGDLDYTDAESAVLAHYGGLSVERIMPGHVRAGVRRIRSARIASTVIPAPPAELADYPQEYLKALRAHTKLAADGHALPAPAEVRAITGGALSGASGPTAFREAIRGVRKVLGPGRPARRAIGDERQVARDQVAEARAAREKAGEGEPA